jgi:hypothetical protein
MTIIFSKSTGKIQAVFSGDLQKIATLYGEDAADFAIIWDEIVIPDDEAVLNSKDKFIVNTVTKELQLRPEYAIDAEKYSVAKVDKTL